MPRALWLHLSSGAATALIGVLRAQLAAKLPQGVGLSQHMAFEWGIKAPVLIRASTLWFG